MLFFRGMEGDRRAIQFRIVPVEETPRIGHIVQQLERQREQVIVTDVVPGVANELRAQPWFRDELLALNVEEALSRIGA
jgi:hypothetical protein